MPVPYNVPDVVVPGIITIIRQESSGTFGNPSNDQSPITLEFARPRERPHRALVAVTPKDPAVAVVADSVTLWIDFMNSPPDPIIGSMRLAAKLAAIETHVADARTCCLNPATSTHRQMNDEQLAAAGIPAGLIRISCGLEDKNDLIADIAQALDAI